MFPGRMRRPRWCLFLGLNKRASNRNALAWRKRSVRSSVRRERPLQSASGVEGGSSLDLHLGIDARKGEVDALRKQLREANKKGSKRQGAYSGGPSGSAVVRPWM